MDTETQRWTRLDDAPCEFNGSGFIEMDGTAYVLGNNAPSLRRLFLSFTLKGGWVREEDLPFEVCNAATLSVGRHLVVMGGWHHETAVHAYDTVTGEWQDWGSTPFEFSFGRSVTLSPCQCLLHTS
ncbi:hypothetical protein KIPB_012385, partial [Kipferlia bialata]|eukprot:g12385.t1